MPAPAKIVLRAAAAALAAAGTLLLPFAAASMPATRRAPSAAGHAPSANSPSFARALVHHKNGDRAMSGGDLRAAAAEYARAALAAPEEPLFRLTAGVALAALGRVGDAAEQFRQARSRAEDDVIAAFLLEGALEEQGQTAQALTVHRETVRRFDRSGQGRWNASGSLARLTRAVTLLPGSAVAWLLLGDAYQLSEQWEEAAQAYGKARALAPRWVKPSVNLGVLRLAQGRPHDAVKAFEAALALEPRNVQAQLLKADAQARMGNAADALRTYKKVEVRVQNAPRAAADVATRAGNVLLQEKRPDEALSQFSRAQKLAPKDPSPVAGTAEAQLQAGNYQEAAAAYTSALRLANSGGLLSTRPILYRGLAEAQLSAGDPEAALQTLRRALGDEPQSAALWHRLSAQAHFAKGDTASGEKSLLQALNSETVGRYPLDTLRAIDAQGLVPHITEAYRTDLARSARPTGVPSIGPRNPLPLVALAHLAQYRNDTEEEVRLREEVAHSRQLGVDWFLLAQAYERANLPQKARDACAQALQRGGLPPAAAEWARSRLKAPPVTQP